MWPRSNGSQTPAARYFWRVVGVCGLSQPRENTPDRLHVFSNVFGIVMLFDIAAQRFSGDHFPAMMRT